MGNKIKRHSFILSSGLCVILIIFLSQAFTSDPFTIAGWGSKEPTLRQLADKAGLLIGVTGPSRDSVRVSILEREFNTATRTCYPRSINRSPGQHDLETFNSGVNWLYERGMKPLHHMLFGPSHYEQEWVGQITSATSLDSLMRLHFFSTGI